MASEDTSYSLWLRPTGEIAFSLQQRIQKLSKKYDTPAFEPHVTLLGGLKDSHQQLINLTDTLASSLRPFEILLTRAGTGSSFFQSVFVHIKKTNQLSAARERAEKLFDLHPEESYMPHLSLLYGDLSTEQKQRILNSMGREFHIRFSVSGVFLIKTSGLPKTWEKVHSAEFGRKK